jgi:hypothetical protein
MTAMIWGGLAFAASGLFHVGVWLIDGMPPLEGPVSWRKPIVFGLSTGVLTLSLAWALSLLPQSQTLKRQTAAFVTLLTAELGLIALQQWRGVGSHFNVATPLDGAIFTAMGVIISIAAVLIAIWTWALFRPVAAPRHEVLAARAGMLLLNAGNIIGVFIAAWGATQLASGAPPNVFGEAGQLKLPHAIALHGLQVLPLLAWLASPAVSALRIVGLGTAGYTTLLLFSLTQTFSGRTPFDLTLAGALLLVTAVSLLGRSAVLLWRQSRMPWSILAQWTVAR